MAVEKTADGSELGMDVVCRFAGHLAHELNNLLTPIIACGQMLRDGIDKNDPLYFCAEQVADAGDRCLEFSRKLQIIGSKRSSGQVMECSSLLHEALRVVKLPAAPAIRIDQSGAAVGAAGYYIKIDMEQFFFLVNELVSNAIAVMPQGGVIRVGLSANVPAEADRLPPAPNGWVELTFADEGAGMTPEVMARIYEPYFSTHGQEREKGLGLTLVYGIVRRAGGAIHCESAPGAGTIFRLYFPRRLESDIT